MPIGNLTSQLFANVYLNELDHFIKEQLHVKHYLRYTDDFVVISDSESYLQGLIMPIQQFLVERLHLQLHPHKVTIRKFSQGIDFLGYVLLPHYRRVRTRTKQRIFKKLAYQQSRYRQGKISRETLDQSVQSYLGVLSHANSHKLSEKLKNAAWLD
ncbi:MAG: RNA-directed DNA polymerase [Candidatus Andersenbacteria bacterium]